MADISKVPEWARAKIAVLKEIKETPGVFAYGWYSIMATTALLPIHVNKGKSRTQTLIKRIDYAINPVKTDGSRLVTGYACDPRTAALEFNLSKQEYEHITGRSQGDKEILLYHLRQSFKPGEITPEYAMEVGYELAQRLTKGKHAYVVAVHIDQEHIHSAIIINSTTLDCRGKAMVKRQSFLP